MRRSDRPESCTIHPDADVCGRCPNLIPPCLGVGDRSICPGIAELAARHRTEDAEIQRRGKPHGSLADAVTAARKVRGI